MESKNTKYPYSLDKLKDFAGELFDKKVDKQIQKLEIERKEYIQAAIQVILYSVFALIIDVFVFIKFDFIRSNPYIIKYAVLGLIILLAIIWIKSILKRIANSRISFVLWDFICPLLVFIIAPSYHETYRVIESIPSLLMALMVVFVFIVLFMPVFTFEAFKKKGIKLKTKMFKSIENIYYDNGSEILTNQEIKNSSIFARYDTETIYTGCEYKNPIMVDDTFSGEYNGVKFEVEEVSFNLLVLIFWVFNRSGIFKYYHEYNIFEGIIIQFPLNKNNKSNTLFATQKDIFILNNTLSAYLNMVFIYIMIGVLLYLSFRWIQTPAIIISFLYIASVIPFLFHFIAKLPKLLKYKSDELKNLKPVKLESPEWEKRFKAYSNNQVEARYMLTTAFMERFLNLTTAFGTDKAKCSFYDDKIMIAISTKKDLFEFGNLFKPVSKDKFYEELNSIIEMIDYFKLDTHTGL